MILRNILYLLIALITLGVLSCNRDMEDISQPEFNIIDGYQVSGFSFYSWGIKYESYMKGTIQTGNRQQSFTRRDTNYFYEVLDIDSIQFSRSNSFSFNIKFSRSNAYTYRDDNLYNVFVKLNKYLPRIDTCTIEYYDDYLMSSDMKKDNFMMKKNYYIRFVNLPVLEDSDGSLYCILRTKDIGKKIDSLSYIIDAWSQDDNHGNNSTITSYSDIKFIKYIDSSFVEIKLKARKATD